ncbi:MAG: peptidylprolyl isomerase [Candidatus Zixiibacteriota bacterium]
MKTQIRTIRASIPRDKTAARPRLKLGLVLWLFLFLSNSLSAQQVLDRIVAVVGNEIILDSELKMQMTIYLGQRGTDVKSEEERSQLEKELLDQMVNNKLLLLQAQKDTTIQISSKELETAVNDQLKKVKSDFSEEAFQAQLQAEGLTESELRKKYREQVKNQMMIDRLTATKLSGVSVSSKEVKDFYETYRDSIPDQPQSVKLSHILLEIKPSKETLDSLKGKAEKILELIREGKDFAQLASQYSDDPSGKEGGDLGFFGKGDMIPKFEAAAFALNPGEVSGVVETEFGYHIIKLEEKKDDRIHARHILVLVRPLPQDTLRVQKLADSLYQELLKGADFGEAAKNFSADEDTKKLGGNLGWYPLADLTPEFREGTKDLQVGQIGPPIKSQFGIHILKVLERKEERKLTLEDDWDAIKDMVRRKKTNELVAKWVEKMRQQAYVEIRL